MDHRLRLLEDSIDVWSRVPNGWHGLKIPTADRFIENLESVSDRREPGATGWTVQKGRELTVRAAALYRQGMESKGIERVSEGARRILSDQFLKDPSAAPWALAEVVAWDSSRNDSRRPGSDWRPSTHERKVVISLLSELREKKLRGALLAIVRRESDPLRGVALSQLARWASDFEPDEVVDLVLVKLLGRSSEYRGGPQPMNVILERIDSNDEPLGERAQEALRVRIAQLLIAPDWRKAAIGLRLSSGLSVDKRVPMLLDGLNVWNQRHRSGRPYSSMVRIRGDLVRELQKISDLKHGPEPGPWIDWWVRVQQGKSPMPGSPEFEEARSARASEPVSRAGFFGLKPTTDRVTFIIDHSGSMDQTWGTTDKTRYEEAIDQMLRFLQGTQPGTQFNVILFDNEPLRSSLGLVEATPANLEKARKSLLDRRPAGGTNLRPAVSLALGLGPDGLPEERMIDDDDEEALADTIVVLCDGATAEGSAWVGPVLRRALPLYPVVFHTVHLGPSDDGALSSLARVSGGDFMRVGN